MLMLCYSQHSEADTLLVIILKLICHRQKGRDLMDITKKGNARQREAKVQPHEISFLTRN